MGFINGNIITMKGRVIQQAVAVTKDRILGVGTNEQIMAMTNKMTHVIDLKGKTLLPGFIDTHVHLLGFGFSFESIDLFNTGSHAELVEMCKKPGETACIKVIDKGSETIIRVVTPPPAAFEHLMI